MLGTLVMNSFSKAFINGALHWGGVTKKGGSVVFLSYHLVKNEVTKYIKVPKIDLGGREWYPFDRNGSLAMVVSSTHHQRFVGDTFEIWVMNEYGAEKSWTKQLTNVPSTFPS